jgi:Niemann-Pick C2 protein
VTPEIHGIIGAASIPFPVPNPDGCKDSGITCPVSADQINKYTASFYVEPSYPNIAATVKLELKDDSGKDFFCKLIRGKIK